MTWFFGMIVVGIVIALLLSVVVAIVVAVIEILVRLALGAGLAFAAGLAVGAAAQQAGADGAMIGVLTATLGFVPALLLVGRWRSPKLASPRRGAPRSTSATPDAPLDHYEQAWATAKRLAPRNGLDGAQQSSARVLALSEKVGSLDPEIIDFATALRRHVPALVSETEELLASADRKERHAAGLNWLPICAPSENRPSICLRSRALAPARSWRSDGRGYFARAGRPDGGPSPYCRCRHRPLAAP